MPVVRCVCMCVCVCVKLSPLMRVYRRIQCGFVTALSGTLPNLWNTKEQRGASCYIIKLTHTHTHTSAETADTCVAFHALVSVCNLVTYPRDFELCHLNPCFLSSCLIRIFSSNLFVTYLSQSFFSLLTTHPHMNPLTSCHTHTHTHTHTQKRSLTVPNSQTRDISCIIHESK